MNPTLLSRLHAAAGLIFRSGAPFPFNKIMPYDAMGGERMSRAYEQSAWVMRAIKKIAGPISAVDWRFTRQGLRHAAPELEAFWEEPALGLTRSDFIEATVGWLKLEGEAFWILDDEWLRPFPVGGAGSHLTPLIVARPDRMRHVVRNGELQGWEYVDGAGQKALLLTEQVVQIKLWNPYNEWRGLAELKPCRDAAEADFLAGKFNLNLMRNNGDQGVYVIAKSGMPTDTQRQQIVDQIREKRELAQRGVFKPVFLGGDVSIEDPKIRVPDKGFIATRLQNRHEIFIAMGVPASMADVKASYSIGSASDWFQLICETCIPTGEKISAAVNRVLRRQSGPDVRMTLDWDEHPVIQSVRRERADTAAKYFAMGVPLKVLNDYLDLELPPSVGWEKGYLPFNLTAVESVVVPEQDGALVEPMDDTFALARMKKALSPVERMKAVLSEKVEESKGERDPKELAQWRELMGQRREVAKGIESRLNRELLKARTEALRGLAGGKMTGVKMDIGEALRPLVEAGMQKAGEQLFEEIGSTDVFVMPRPEAEEFMSARVQQWGEESARVSGEIEEAMLGGDADLVRATCNKISKGFAAQALDEGGRIYGIAREAAMKLAGVAEKRWLSSGHAQTRETHQAANGQTVKVGEVFLIDGEKLRFPADGQASAENARGCQCVAVAAGASTKKSARMVLTRTIHPRAEIIDAKAGIVDYIASDESIDSYKEIIRASGWRFHHFAKNAPFVDSHDYSTIEKCLGKVIDFRVEGGRLIERVQWAIDVPENKLAQIGWKMTQAGYLKAVSVGFYPVKYLTPNSGAAWAEQLKELGLPADAPVRTIYTEQEQVELSCCVVGANANALAKAYEAGAIDAGDLEMLSMSYSENAGAADGPAPAAAAREQARKEFVERLQTLVKRKQ